MKSRNYFLRVAPATALLATLAGCVPSLGPGLAGVSSFSGRTVALTGLDVRTDLRLPRTYALELGTDTFVGTRLPDAQEPAERLGVNFGIPSLPDAGERFGWRFGLRGGVWHGALADDSSRWAFDTGVDFSPVVRIGPRLPPWEADETVSINPLFMPTLFVDPLVRAGHTEQSRFALSYGLMLSFGVAVSSTLVP